MIPKKDLKPSAWYLGSGRGSHVARWTGTEFAWPAFELTGWSIDTGAHYEDGGCFRPMEEIKEQYPTAGQWAELSKDVQVKVQLKATQRANMTDCLKCGTLYEAASQSYAEDPERRCGPCITAWAESRPCPDCGAADHIFTTKKEEILKYRSGPDTVELKCVVPLRTCGACGFQFLDYEVEQIHLLTTNKFLISIGEKPQSR